MVAGQITSFTASLLFMCSAALLHSLSGSVALLLSDLMGRGARALREEQRGCQTVGLCGWLKVRGSKRWDNSNLIKNLLIALTGL